MKRWWERLPDRYQFELEALDEVGFPYLVDEAARQQGRIVLDVEYIDGETKIKLQVHFPDLYPHFPFGVIAPDLALPHHQDPLTKALCLLGMDTERWRPKLTVAQLLKEQIPKLLRVTAPDYEAGTAADAGTIDELRDGEPITAYMWKQLPGSHIGIGDWNLPAQVKGGTLLIGLHSRSPPRGTVLEVRDRDGNVLASAEGGVAALYEKGLPRIQGRWVRFTERPSTDEPDELYAQIIRRNPMLQLVQRPHRNNTSIEIVGAMFPDELTRGKLEDNWIFIAREARIVPPRKAPIVRLNLLRTGRDSRADFAARVPELKPLQEKAIAVFGLGSLGSVSALEFARAGVRELRLVDRDVLEVGNTVRWAIGRVAAGLPKANAMEAFIAANYPYTKVIGHDFNVGHPYLQARPIELFDGELLEKILANVDLVFDATAQQSVSYLMSEVCWERRIPYVWVTTTPGAWGGIVGRAVPGVTEGCWYCFKAWQDNGIESPVVGGDPNVQPAGCVHATFTGTAVDINPIACAAVRLAIGTLCGTAAGGYPRGDWDVGVVNLRTQGGKLIPPTWSVRAAKRHDACGHS